MGAVTRPDSAKGRGRRVLPSPVRQAAEELKIPVYTPRPKQEPASLIQIVRESGAQVSVVVGYGRIFSRELLRAPPLGSINLHASLLPKLRGPAPLQWAIARGLEETGVTVIRMSEKMDAGPILASQAVSLGESESMRTLGPRLARLGGELLLQTLSELKEGRATETAQRDALATYAPKVDRASARIDWSRSAEEVDAHARGMDDVPGAWTVHRGRPLKLFSSRVRRSGARGGEPGEVLALDSEGELVVGTGRGAVAFREAQPAGKPRMRVARWMHGRGIEAAERFAPS